MQKQHRNVLVLCCSQATLQTTTVTMIAVTGLAGFALAENKAFATVPLTCYVIGSAISTVPASLLMGAVGRRAGFQAGTLLGVAAGIVSGAAVWLGSFWMLCAGLMLMGMYTAFGKYYRFAAADAASDSFRAKAISLTLAGGILGGIIGPELAKHTTELFEDHRFVGAYLALSFVAVVAMLILTQLDIPKLTAEQRQGGGRPLREIMRQPEFFVSVLVAMMSYGLMNLMMTSTPLAMHAHDHHFHDSLLVIEWHIIAMYGPSFVTGSLIARFGVLRVIFAGILIYFGSAASALAGTAFIHFWLAMFLCGIGWNFMYIGATSLLTTCHTPAERAKTQAVNDFLIFATMAISSMSSGLLLNRSGWFAVNLGTIPFLTLAAGATLWLMWYRRAARERVPGAAE